MVVRLVSPEPIPLQGSPAVKRLILWFILLLFAAPLAVGAVWQATRGWPESWRAADWSATGIAPDPAANGDAIIQVYAARAGRWKSIFSVHSWILLKPAGAERYTRYEVVGWGTPVRRDAYPPDGRWYGNPPQLVYNLRGEAAARLIPTIEAAIGAYPHNARGSYRIWPGPNSNSFVAWVARTVRGFDPVLPPNAVGKDYLGSGLQLAGTPSGTGWQVSLYGVLGATVAQAEGIEVNLFGLVGGVHPTRAALALPSFGRVDLGELISSAKAALLDYDPTGRRDQVRAPEG